MTTHQEEPICKNERNHTWHNYFCTYLSSDLMLSLYSPTPIVEFSFGPFDFKVWSIYLLVKIHFYMVCVFVNILKTLRTLTSFMEVLMSIVSSNMQTFAFIMCHLIGTQQFLVWWNQSSFVVLQEKVFFKIYLTTSK